MSNSPNCSKCQKPVPCGNPECNSVAGAGDGNAQNTNLETNDNSKENSSLDFSESKFQDNEVEITMVDALFAREQNPQQPVTVTGNEQRQNSLSKKRESSADTRK